MPTKKQYDRLAQFNDPKSLEALRETFRHLDMAAKAILSVQSDAAASARRVEEAELRTAVEIENAKAFRRAANDVAAERDAAIIRCADELESAKKQHNRELDAKEREYREKVKADTLELERMRVHYEDRADLARLQQEHTLAEQAQANARVLALLRDELDRTRKQVDAAQADFAAEQQDNHRLNVEIASVRSELKDAKAKVDKMVNGIGDALIGR